MIATLYPLLHCDEGGVRHINHLVRTVWYTDLKRPCNVIFGAFAISALQGSGSAVDAYRCLSLRCRLPSFFPGLPMRLKTFKTWDEFHESASPHPLRIGCPPTTPFRLSPQKIFVMYVQTTHSLLDFPRDGVFATHSRMRLRGRAIKIHQQGNTQHVFRSCHNGVYFWRRL